MKTNKDQSVMEATKKNIHKDKSWEINGTSISPKEYKELNNPRQPL